MQGVVNHLGQFTDVYVGWPGRVHDARVFRIRPYTRKDKMVSFFPIGRKQLPANMSNLYFSDTQRILFSRD